MSVCARVGFATAASQDWGSGFGPVTVGREHAKRAPDLVTAPKPRTSFLASEQRSTHGGSERVGGGEGNGAREGVYTRNINFCLKQMNIKVLA